MSQKTINQTVLMSDTSYLKVEELNPYSKLNVQPDALQAAAEHQAIRQAFAKSDIEVVQVSAPLDCPDGIYTANWALCWKGKVVLSSLPNRRQAEEPYAKHILESMGYKTIAAPFKFSGQGDALPCGDYLFVGSNYRTDSRMHQFLQAEYKCQVIGVETIPELDRQQKPIINPVTGWPDSYFYDLDLALAVITPELIAWCPEAFTPISREKIEQLPLNKITVSLSEAKDGFACNLVSSGETVVMSNKAPKLQQQLENYGLQTITPAISELSKGGGYIRCCSLTLA